MAATDPCGQPGSPYLCESLEVFATPTGRYHGRMLIRPSLPACATPRSKRCLHTRRFGTLASPPPPVCGMPWRPHPPGHQVFPIHHESSLRTLRNGLFRREEVVHDEGQLVATYPNKFSQVSLIDRLPQKISQDLDIHTRSSPGLMKLKTARPKAFSLLKFIISLDFAVTRSSPDSC